MVSMVCKLFQSRSGWHFQAYIALVIIKKVKIVRGLFIRGKNSVLKNSGNFMFGKIVFRENEFGKVSRNSFLDTLFNEKNTFEWKSAIFKKTIRESR